MTYEKAVKVAGVASITAAIILIASKMIAWMLTGSSSILASLTDSMLDVMTSTLNFLVITYAVRPADNEHRFGHGKAEGIAGLAQAAFIAGSSVLLIIHSLQRLNTPETIQHVPFGIAVSVFAILVTFGLLLIQHWVIKHTNSVAIKADHVHYKGDLLMNLAVIIGLLLPGYGFLSADSLIAIFIGIYLLVSAFQVAKESADTLMDREVDEVTQVQIESLASSHPDVHGVHALRTRQSGKTLFIQLHIELDDHLPLVEAHRITEEVEVRLETAFPHSDVLLHQDPVSIVKQGLDRT